MMEICELYLKDGSVNYDAVSHNLLLTNSKTPVDSNNDRDIQNKLNFSQYDLKIVI